MWGAVVAINFKAIMAGLMHNRFLLLRHCLCLHLEGAYKPLRYEVGTASFRTQKIGGNQDNW